MTGFRCIPSPAPALHGRSVRPALSATAPPRLDSPLTTALIGCGQVARKHAHALRWHQERLEVAGVVDPHLERSQALADQLKARAFPTLDALFEACSPELVTIASPTGLHSAHAVAAARAGAHVLLEKPLSTSLEDARQMLKALRLADRQLFVIKQLRHHPLFLALRDAVKRGRFGRIYTVGLQVFWNRSQSYYDSADWRGTRALDGGALMNQASHYVDLLTWLFDTPADVFARGAALGRAIEVEDTALLTLRWPEGMLGTMHVTMLTYPQNLTTSLTIIGERGTVRLSGRLCDTVEAWDFERPEAQDKKVPEMATSVGEVLARGHALVLGAVLDHLGGHPNAPIVSGEEGLRSLAIIEAAYASMRTGRPVNLEH
ncbi:Gfo/Idh/MocA family protein [Lujinxingia litoralis]|nr:Gfo/Idh/MocA family oxidoreductase [Lujinxingia litoralis]